MPDGLDDQRKTIDGIMSVLCHAETSAHHISGPSGCGKSWTAQQLCSEWERLGNPFLVALGDSRYSSRDFHPFLVAITGTELSLDKKRAIKKAVSQSTKVVPTVGNLASYLLDTLFDRSETKQKLRTPFLSEREHEILFRTQDFVRSDSLLVVADNLHWWDRNSLQLLLSLFFEKTQTVFPFLRRLHLVTITTSDQERLNPELVGQITSDICQYRWQCEYVKEERFHSVLQELGLRYELPPKTLHLFYTLSGANLQLSQQVCKYISEMALDETEVIDILSSIHADSFPQDFLQLRFRSVEKGSRDVLEFLEAASTIGLSFSEREIECLTNLKHADASSMVSTAEGMQLVYRQAGRMTFQHEILRDFFEKRAQSKRRSYHESFAECLRLLRPSDYQGRYLHLRAAEQDRESAAILFVAELSRIRNGQSISTNDKEHVLSIGKNHGFDSFFRSVFDGYDFYLHQEYLEAVKILEQLEDIYPNPLLAERDYLLSLCLLKSSLKTKRQRARETLVQWQNLSFNEGEIWSRIMSTLLVACVHLGELEEAKKIESQLMTYFSMRMDYDSEIGTSLNVLRRKAASLHSSEIAVKRTKDAAEYFGPSATGTAPRNPLEYYRALSNLSGNQTVQGDYDSAWQAAQKALDLVRQFPDMSFPRLEIPTNNLVIAGLLADYLNSEEARRLVEAALSSTSDHADSILLRNNLAVFMTMSGKLDEARLELESLSKRIERENSSDDYYFYFVNSNLIALEYLLGTTSEGLAQWINLSKRIPQIPEGDRIMLIRRHDLLIEAIGDVPKGDFVGWQYFLQRNYAEELGRAWRFFRNGFLLTDIQFWSES